MLDLLLPKIAFLSVGTNDLTQFLFAADRANPKLAERYDWLSPAILRFLQRVVAATVGHPVHLGVCGEMGGRQDDDVVHVLDYIVLLGLERAEPQLFEPRDLELRERLEREVPQRRTPPQRERFAERGGGAAGIARGQRIATRSGSLLEDVEVERAGLDHEQVAARPGRDRIASERLAQLRDVAVQQRRDVGGGSSPQSASISRSPATGVLRCSTSSARSARSRPLPIARGRSPSRASSGPRMPNSITPPT